MAASIDIGISDSDRREIAEGLSRLLADTYSLYLKTHNYHWNVVGPMFNTLHLMFEVQYNELALAVDLVAERIRALGERAPASYREFAALSTVPEDEDQPNAMTMIQRLVDAQEAVARTARGVFPIAEGANDQPTADLLTQRMQAHEKTAWMLRSMLEWQPRPVGPRWVQLLGSRRCSVSCVVHAARGSPTWVRIETRQRIFPGAGSC